MEISEVKFARSGDVNVAYQVYGAGAVTINIPPLISNVELSWEEDTYRRARERIGRYLRIIEFDKRGIGGSDRFEKHPTLEERICDIQAVMDAENVKRANVIGLSEGGVMAQYFAAKFPERVERLVLINSMFGLSAYDELQQYSDTSVRPLEVMLERVTQAVDVWGREPEVFVDVFAPSQRGNPAFVRWIARFQRQSATLADMRRQLESVTDLDANAHLGDIIAPTLVANVVGDRIFDPAVGRFLADKIRNAQFAEFPGEDHLCWVMPDWPTLADHVIEFLTGEKPKIENPRRFATVMFTDIVGSTTRAAAIGDRAWMRALENHDRIAWKTVGRHGGSLIKNTGDGLLITFDTPSEAIACASELTARLSREQIVIRAGVHAGEIEVREDGDIGGLSVHLAARVEQAANEGTTWVSSTVRDMLIGSGEAFAERGEHVLKGIEGKWRLYEHVGERGNTRV